MGDIIEVRRGGHSKREERGYGRGEKRVIQKRRGEGNTIWRRGAYMSVCMYASMLRCRVCVYVCMNVCMRCRACVYVCMHVALSLNARLN